MRLIDVDKLIDIGMFDEEEAAEMLFYAAVEQDEQDEQDEEEENQE